MTINAVGVVSGVIARRNLSLAMEIANRLKSLDYTVAVEFHAKHWLVQWTFPR